jgi:hypothetical protein
MKNTVLDNSGNHGVLAVHNPPIFVYHRYLQTIPLYKVVPAAIFVIIYVVWASYAYSSKKHL